MILLLVNRINTGDDGGAIADGFTLDTLAKLNEVRECLFIAIELNWYDFISHLLTYASLLNPPTLITDKGIR